MLREIANNETEPDSVTKYSRLLIARGKSVGDDEKIYHGYRQLGNGFRLKGDFKQALKAYFKSPCKERGKIEMKNKGMMSMYFVESNNSFKTLIPENIA